MIPWLLLSVTLAATPDVYLILPDGDKTLTLALCIQADDGSWAAREKQLLGDWQPSDDGSDPLDQLLPDGHLLRVEVKPLAPHAQLLTSAIFHLLDRDHDGKLSAIELKDADNRLLARFDGDGDDCLNALEILPDLLTREPIRPKVVARPRIVWPSGATQQVDATYTIGVNDNPLSSHPHGEWTLDFDHRPVSPLVTPPIPRSLLAPERAKEKTRFEAVAKSLHTLTILPQPLGWFARLDADGDGQLSSRELAKFKDVIAPGTTLPDYASGNALSLSISPGMATRPPVRLTPIRLPRKGLEWFIALDTNFDGDVSRREFLGNDAQFQKFDTNRDGLMSAEEAEAGSRPQREKQP